MFVSFPYSICFLWRETF